MIRSTDFGTSRSSCAGCSWISAAEKVVTTVMRVTCSPVCAAAAGCLPDCVTATTGVPAHNRHQLAASPKSAGAGRERGARLQYPLAPREAIGSPRDLRGGAVAEAIAG